MFSVALTAFLTRVTEPLEFTFIFVAWPLLVIHAVLTGSCLALVNALDIHSGFVFSAGAIDYLLNFGISQRVLWLIPIGLGYAIVYCVVFRFVITKWNLRTPAGDRRHLRFRGLGRVSGHHQQVKVVGAITNDRMERTCPNGG